LLGSSLPLWPLQKLAFEVFASPSVRKSISFSDDPLVTFRSPPELAHPGAAGRTNLARLPPLRFLPLRRFPDDGQPLIPGLPAPWVSFPSQRFSRSQGLAPPTICRPCFMPVPPMGFSLQGRFPPAELYVLSDAFCPLVVDPRPPLQGFDPCERLSFPEEPKLIRRQRPSWASPP
jgi:hypothetical protein